MIRKCGKVHPLRTRDEPDKQTRVHNQCGSLNNVQYE